MVTKAVVGEGGPGITRETGGRGVGWGQVRGRKR